jgi:outer membrane protein assembly factor BamD
MNKYYIFLILSFPVILMQGCSFQRPKLILTAEEQYYYALYQLETRDYLKAIESYQIILNNYPGCEFIDRARYGLGMAYFENNEFILSEFHFKKVVEDFPKSELSDDAQFMAGLSNIKQTLPCELDQEKTRDAIDVLTRYLFLFPQGRHQEQAQNHLNELRSKLAEKLVKTGNFYLKLKKYEAAKIYFREVLNDYTDTAFVQEATLGLAEAFFKIGDVDNALTIYENVLEISTKKEVLQKAKKRIQDINGKKT